MLSNNAMITNKRQARKPKTDPRRWDAAQALLVACLVVTLLWSTQPVRAQGGNTPGGDPIVDQLIAADLVTPIDHTTTVNGVDVNINWVYADVNQVIVSLTMLNIDPTNTPPGATPAKEKIRVATPAGGEFVPRHAYADISVQGAVTVVTQFYGQVYTPTPDDYPYPSFVDNYFATLGPDLPDTVDLALLLDIEVNMAAGNWMRPIPGEPAELTLPVTVNLHPGITVTPQQTVTAQGYDITLQQLTITPSQASLELCFDLPDGGDWQPRPILHIDDQEASWSSYGLTELPTPEDTSRCVQYSFATYHAATPTTITLEVTALRSSIPDTLEFWETVRDGLAEAGIEIEIYPRPGVFYDVVSHPADMDDQTLHNRIHDEQVQHTPVIEGSWHFTIEIPSEA